jgi:DNA-directed RNA polymerase III subunit RPC8
MVFCLTTLRDVVRVPPDKFDRELLEVLLEELDKKYSNKVIADVGLCIYTHDLKQVQDAVIYPADGGAHHRIVFRMVVYRPLVSEVAVGTIMESNTEGIRVSVDFFEDIFIPHYLLPQPSIYDVRTRLWVWRYEGAEEGGVFSMHEQVRFRIESVAYSPQAANRTANGSAAALPNPPSAAGGAVSALCAPCAPPSSSNAGAGGSSGSSSSSSSSSSSGAGGATAAAPAASASAVMSITASCNDHGLGLVCWRWE